MFHLMQLLEMPDAFCVWNRWGKVGTKGQEEVNKFVTLESATSAFKYRFHEKTNNKWECRKSFKQFFGKWSYSVEPGVDVVASSELSVSGSSCESFQ